MKEEEQNIHITHVRPPGFLKAPIVCSDASQCTLRSILLMLVLTMPMPRLLSIGNWLWLVDWHSERIACSRPIFVRLRNVCRSNRRVWYRWMSIGRRRGSVVVGRGARVYGIQLRMLRVVLRGRNSIHRVLGLLGAGLWRDGVL